MDKRAIVLVGDPVVEVIAESKIDWKGVEGMTRWVNDRRPECVPDEAMKGQPEALFPHTLMRDMRTSSTYEDRLTDNELLVELAGRKCYDSFGAKAGKKSNAEYIANTQGGDIVHASIMYHAKMTFFFAGISRRVSHELIRNYVGADRDEEGCPSQESTRYVEHAGRYIAHPGMLEHPDRLSMFTEVVTANYENYLKYINRAMADLPGGEAKGVARKRVYESASSLLIHACETSWIWTTNPIALAKLIRERANEAADLEFQRFAKKLASVCVNRWPNLFPQSHVRTAAHAHGF